MRFATPQEPPYAGFEDTSSTHINAGDQLMSTFERMLQVLGGRTEDAVGRIASSLRSGSRRPVRGRGSRRASKRLAAGIRSEQLEPRLALEKRGDSISRAPDEPRGDATSRAPE